MKKNIIYSFLVLLLLSACDDYLDIRPKGRLIPEKVQDYEKMLNGPRLLINSTPILEILGDNVWPRDAYPWYSDEEKRAYQWADYIWSAEVSTPMNDAYERIFVYNTIINNIDDAIDATNSNTKPVVAEARLARAWEYFYLVNMYGKHFDKKTSAADLGVVLLTKDDITQTIPERSTVKEVYDFVINEIVEIADDLPEESNAIRMNKTTAYAILSRAYLYQGEWQKCADAASVVLGKKADLLDYNEVSLIRGSVYRGLENFPQTEDNPENILVRAFPLYGGVTTYASASAITLFDDNDLRWTLFFTNKNYFGDPLGDGIYFYFRRSIWTNVGLSVPEILLSRAEAYVRLGGESNRNKAMQDVNLLRKHRVKNDNYADLTAVDDDTALKLTLDERRREAMYNGLRWFDLKRLNKDPRFKKDLSREIEGETFTLPAGDNRYVLAFPRNILFFNEHITPNPR